MPDTKDFDGFGTDQPIRYKVGKLRNRKLPRFWLDSNSAALGKTAEDLNGVVNATADLVGRG